MNVFADEWDNPYLPGEVAQFPTGPGGAHQIVNRTDEPARYIIAAVHVSPEVVEHVDSGKVLAMARTEGKPLWNDSPLRQRGTEARTRLTRLLASLAAMLLFG